MPVFDFFHWHKDHGKTLTETGPLVAVEISIPAALKEHLAANALPIPAPQSGYALVDTGASHTAVHEDILIALGVQHIDEMPTGSPHGEAKSKIYPATVTFPGMNVKEMPMERVIGCKLAWKTKDDKEIIMLLGRDLLQYFLMVYNGPASDVTLCY